ENLLLKQLTDGPAPWSPARAEPDVDRPAVVRMVVALPEFRTQPKGRRRVPAVNAPRVSSGVGALQVPAVVLLEAMPEEARTERAGRSRHPSHHRTQVAQPSVWLPTD